MPSIPYGYQRIEGSERAAARGAKRTGSMDPNEKVAFTLRVRARPGAPSVSQLLDINTKSGGPRKFLSREGLIAISGGAQADLDKVSKFVRLQGMEVLEISAPRRSIRVSATAAQIKRIFAVDLGIYESPKQKYRGREGYVYLPNKVADVVTGVFGLDKRKVFRHNMGSGPPGSAPLTPAEVAGLYNFPPLFPSVAAGRSIAILEIGDGGFSQTDLNQFCVNQKIPAPTPILVGVNGQSTSQNGDASSPSDGDGEVALDTQVVAAIAQGADIVVFFASDGDNVDLLTNAAFFDYPSPLSAISISWGAPEDNLDIDSTERLEMDAAFGDISVLGVPILSSSGDAGSSGYDDDNNAHVQYPASNPWVTSCGGTIITNVTKSTFKEDVWNDSSGATGGGISALYPVPGWQLGLEFTQFNPPSGPSPLTGRGLPDIAGNASPFSGYPLVLYGTLSNENGGTSAVSPLYAGLMTIFAAKVGWSMGLLSPLLYAIANFTPDAFVDIADNLTNELTSASIYGSTPTPCPAFFCTKGWDACTGLGRINGVALLDAIIVAEELRALQPAIPFSFAGGGEWLFAQLGGADGTGNSIGAGQVNTADPQHATIINTPCQDSATFASINTNPGNGAVGLFGESQGSSWSIGVAGESETGVAVYGIATGGQPTSPNVVGVVGRSMGGIATEILPIEQVVDTPIGVLGHSNTGLGVRGHSGPLLKQPQGGVTLKATPAAPGGVFSSGRLQDQALSYIFPTAHTQTVGMDALAQARLVPSVAAVRTSDTTRALLPLSGQVGDLYLVVPQVSQGPTAGFFSTAQLYVCTAVVPEPGDVANPPGPRWQAVQLGDTLLRGGPIP
jgi:kumamolisin